MTAGSCIRCGATIDAPVTFCPSCGLRQPTHARPCPGCAAEIDDAVAFCPRCGCEVATTPLGLSPQRFGYLKSLFSEAQWNDYEAGIIFFSRPGFVRQEVRTLEKLIGPLSSREWLFCLVADKTVGTGGRPGKALVTCPDKSTMRANFLCATRSEIFLVAGAKTGFATWRYADLSSAADVRGDLCLFHRDGSFLSISLRPTNRFLAFSSFAAGFSENPGDRIIAHDNLNRISSQRLEWREVVLHALQEMCLGAASSAAANAPPPPIAAAPPPPPAPAVTPLSVPAAWLADPMRRHQLRYWDGAAWTAHVSDDGVAGTDPLA